MKDPSSFTRGMMKRPLPIDTDGKSIARCGGSTQEGELFWGGNITDINGSRSSSGKTRKMSAGWELEIEMREGTSFLGDKAADLAAENSTSHTAPLPPQAMKQSPKGSVAARHKEHRVLPQP